MIGKALGSILGMIAVIIIGAALLEDQAIDPRVKRMFWDVVGGVSSLVEDALAETDDGPDRPDDGGRVSDPHQAYTLTYGLPWVEDTTRGESGDEFARLSLQQGAIRVSLTTTTQWGSDTSACLEETRAGIATWTNSTSARYDRSVDAPELDLGRPEEAGVFTYTFLDQGSAHRVLVNCIDLPDGVMLAILYDAPANLYDAGLDAREQLLDGLNLAG